ncbi:hypothetical protein ACPF64_08700 [Acinetobacter sp. KB005]|uniref:hypothetical protein n=1 Tax=Acinetobacter sp. KB005 TaxID=3416667 RepID=UPI003CF9CF01
MSEQKSQIIFDYLISASEFIYSFIELHQEYLENHHKGVLEKLQKLGSDLDYFIRKSDEKDKEYLSHHGIYIPLLTRSINLDGFYDVLNDDQISIESKINTLLDFIEETNGIYQEANQYITIYKNVDERNQIVISQMIGDLDEKIKGVDSAIQALNFKETDKIYLDLSEKYGKEYFYNNVYFFSVLALAIIFTINSSSKMDLDLATKNTIYMFIVIKILTISLTITLCSIFLRRASHAKKLKDQAYQTHVEITAFPIHVRSLEKADKDELIKELALKYFGKELDQTQNDKIGNLMKDQLTAGNELIKASAEIVKNVNSLRANVDKT